MLREGQVFTTFQTQGMKTAVLKNCRPINGSGSACFVSQVVKFLGARLAEPAGWMQEKHQKATATGLVNALTGGGGFSITMSLPGLPPRA